MFLHVVDSTFNKKSSFLQRRGTSSILHFMGQSGKWTIPQACNALGGTGGERDGFITSECMMPAIPVHVSRNYVLRLATT